MKISLFSFTVFALLLVGSSALFCGKDNCYELLGVKRSATKAEIRRAYRKLSTEKHPDKRKGEEGALEEFRKIGSAYEALTDDGKRAKYNDFLDNPTKYIDFLIENSTEVYAPKSNVLIVITGVIGFATLMHWLHLNTSYNQTLRRMKDSPGFQKQVTKLVKSKQANTREEAENMIQLEVVGLEEPHWRQLFVFKLVDAPQKFASYVKWNINWFVSYKIRKLEYSTEDKVYLIQKNLGMKPMQWDSLSEKDKTSHMEAEVWDTEKCQEFMRMKRIEMNRLGKGKKKKRTGAQLSDADDMAMSD